MGGGHSSLIRDSSSHSENSYEAAGAQLGDPDVNATQLQTIEIPSGEFFPMWRAHMDSQLEQGIDDMNISFDSVWEFVLGDCRLQYVELLKLDGAVEVEFLSFNEEDTFLASPCADNTIQQTTWKVNNLGWIKVPWALNHEAHKIILSNEWWIGLRNSFSSSIRSLMQYKLFSDRLLRLFIVPINCEDYMRIVITTNMPSVLKLLSDKSNHSSVGARFLAHCLLSKPPGEFPATVQDITDGTQEASETEVFEFLSAEEIESTSAQAEPSAPPLIMKQLTFYRSDSFESKRSTRPQSDIALPHHKDCEVDPLEVTAKGKGDLEKKVPDSLEYKPYAKAAVGSDLRPTAPPISEIEPPGQTYTAADYSLAPSAPPLSDITHKAGML